MENRSLWAQPARMGQGAGLMGVGLNGWSLSGNGFGWRGGREGWSLKYKTPDAVHRAL